SNNGVIVPTEKMAITNTGNVGMGSTAPRAKLEVVGSGTTTATAFQIDDNLYAPKVTVLDNGNVGIGSTLPAEKLDIYNGNMNIGRDDGVSAVEMLTVATGVGGQGPVFMGRKAQGSIATPAATIAGDNLFTLSGVGYSGAAWLSASTAIIMPARETFSATARGADVAFLTTLPTTTIRTEKMRITGEGNLGVGTSAPRGLLEVDITPYTSPFIVTTGLNVGVGVVAPVAKLHVGDGTAPTKSANLSSNSAFIQGNLEVDGKIYGDGSLMTGVATVSGLSTNMITKYNGAVLADSGIYDSGTKVGIGTNAPQAKLEIVGVGSTTGTAFQIDNNLYSPKVTVLDNGNVGIGTTVPGAPMSIYISTGTVPLLLEREANDVAALTMEYDSYGGAGGGNTTGAGYLGRFAKGTKATPSDVAAGDRLGFNVFGGWAGGAFRNTVAINALVDSGTVSATSLPTLLQFMTTADGSITRTERMRITGAGNVGIGTTVPRAKVEIVSAGTTTGTAFQIDDNLYAPKVTVLDNGNVGIGTTSPLVPLHVATGAVTTIGAAPTGNVALIGNYDFAAPGRALRVGISSATINANASGDYQAFALYNNDQTANNLLGYSFMSQNAGAVYTGAVMTATFTRVNNAANLTFKVRTDATTLTDAMTILSSGNVGVGTTVPAARLALVSAGTTTGRAFEIDDNLYNPKVTVLDNGNIGVGTTAPVAKIHVGDGTAPTKSADLSSNSSFIQGNLEVDGKIYGDGSKLTGIAGAVSGLTTYSVPRASNATTLVDSGIYTDASGNIGIGTTVPASSIYVKESAANTGLIVDMNNYDSTQGAFYLKQLALSTLNSNGKAFVFQVTGEGFARGMFYSDGAYGLGGGALTRDVYIKRYSAGNLMIDGDKAGSAANLLVTGNVGVGTTVPLARLSVNGVGTTTGRAFEVDDALYAPKMVVLDNGNIGVGTATPVALLHVKTGGAADYEYTTANPYFSGMLINEKATSGTNRAALSAFLEASVAPADSYAAMLVGYHDSGAAAPSVNGATTAVYGLNAVNVFEGTNARTITNLFAGRYQNVATAATNLTIGTAYGISARAMNGSATMTNSFGVYIADTNVGVGTTAFNAGLYVSNIAAGTSNYAIYSVGGRVLFNQQSDAVSDFQVKGSTVSALLFTDASADRVGIGTSVPAAKLHVIGSGTTTARAFEIDDSLYVPKVTVLDNGNVGIGTTVPVALLHVGGAGTVPNAMAITGADAYIKGNIEFDGKIYGDGSLLTGINAISGLNAGYISKAGSATSIVDSGIYQSGSNIGIGTTAPRGLLEVDATPYTSPFIVTTALNVGVGTVTPTALLQVGAGQSNAMPITGKDAFVAGNLEVDGKIYGDGSALTGVSSISGLNAGYVSRAGSSTTVVDSAIYQNGTNVGIGTIRPGALLQVGVGTSTLGATLAPDSALIKGNLEVDGTVYGVDTNFSGNVIGTFFVGDGSNLSNVSATASTGLSFTGKVSEAAGITIGQCVYISGASGTTPLVSLCDNTNPAKRRMAGIAAQTKANGQNITIRNRGEMTGQNTGAWAEGSPLYISTGGNLTNVMPTSGAIFNIGLVEHQNAATGKMLITTILEPFIGASSGEDVLLRMGDSAGAYKVSFQNYASTEVANINSNGGGYFSKNIGIGTNAPRGLLEVDALPYTSPFIVTTALNVGVGTVTPTALLQVGAGQSNSMPITGKDAYVAGNLEVDGKIYGDGSQLTGIAGAISGLNT
ncbi:MAG: hypothetical protein HQL17_06855, partial [Candidatus Omnitrophica bacterium]|nr:hypothetical protein [Candidatus Omnitrophota bacterium]